MNVGGDGRSLHQLDDGLASVATHLCLWTGCCSRPFFSRAELVSHVESVHVDGAARPRLAEDNGDNDDEMVMPRPRRRRRRTTGRLATCPQYSTGHSTILVICVLKK